MKKKNLLILPIIIILEMACVKNKPLTPVINSPTEAVQTGTKTALGTFMDGAHTTSGRVTLVTDKNDVKKKYLSFENFKTIAGPDLRIYLSEDLTATNYLELSKLDKTGTFVLELPSEAMTDKQKYVLVWCKSFSVLFGSAKLE
jgi:Electron transfer DM13